MRMRDSNKDDQEFMHALANAQEDFSGAPIAIFDNLDRTTLLTNAAAIELQGITEAVSQQSVRAFNAAMLSNSAPREASNVINNVIDNVGVLRSRALASVSVVQAHATGTLDTFQSRGVTHVGMEPEFHKVQTSLFHDVRKKKRPTARQQTLFTRREAKLSRLGNVNVETAGDSKVCPICEDIADEGPYSIDAARGLIPAHPSCRCAFVPADEDE